MKCLICGKKIISKYDGNSENYATTLKLDPAWDRKEPFDFDKHCTDEIIGYKHLTCIGIECPTKNPANNL